MRHPILAVLAGAFTLATPLAPAMAQDHHGHHDRGDHGKDRGHADHGRDKSGHDDRSHGDRGRDSFKDHGRGNRGYGVTSYDAARHYRAGRYQERRLGDNDRIYRGRDNRYYCRRSDGTTGLIVGGLAGGVLGNVITSGGSQTLGTLLGAGGGALLGRSIDRNNVRCR